jgi:hypothetical protein
MKIKKASVNCQPRHHDDARLVRQHDCNMNFSNHQFSFTRAISIIWRCGLTPLFVHLALPVFLLAGGLALTRQASPKKP